jgi:small subunit ribosomal protein S9
MTKKYFYAIGRRKQTTVTLKLFDKGTGNMTVTKSNDKQVSLQDYFGGNHHMLESAMMPFDIIGDNAQIKFDAEIKINGGGLRGQADAIKLAFARALTQYDPAYRLTLKPYGALKRDPRIKERKKPGLKKARKAPTWSKR